MINLVFRPKRIAFRESQAIAAEESKRGRDEHSDTDGNTGSGKGVHTAKVIEVPV